MPSDRLAVENLLRLLEMALNDSDVDLPMWLWIRIADRFRELCELELVNLTVTVAPANGEPQ